MTPAQQSAFEGMAGRSFTPSEAAQIEALATDRDDAALYALLKQISVPVRKSVMVSARGLSAKLEGGPIAAEMILMSLEGARDTLLQSQVTEQVVFGSLLRRQLKFLDADGLDFGDPAFLSMLDQFTAMGILTSAQCDSLKKISLMPRELSMGTMLDILNNSGGA